MTGVIPRGDSNSDDSDDDDDDNDDDPPRRGGVGQETGGTTAPTLARALITELDNDDNDDDDGVELCVDGRDELREDEECGLAKEGLDGIEVEIDVDENDATR